MSPNFEAYKFVLNRGGGSPELSALQDTGLL